MIIIITLLVLVLIIQFIYFKREITNIKVVVNYDENKTKVKNEKKLVAFKEKLLHIEQEISDCMEYIKKVIQWTVGFLIIIGTVFKTFSETGLIKDHKILNIFNWADKTNASPNYLETIGFALAISAGIELGYMLFTEGPDEAVEPAILGIASVILIGISQEDPFQFKISISIFLYVICLIILFCIKRKFIKNKEYEDKKSGVD